MVLKSAPHTFNPCPTALWICPATLCEAVVLSSRRLPTSDKGFKWTVNTCVIPWRWLAPMPHLQRSTTFLLCRYTGLYNHTNIQYDYKLFLWHGWIWGELKTWNLQNLLYTDRHSIKGTFTRELDIHWYHWKKKAHVLEPSKFHCWVVVLCETFLEGVIGWATAL